MRRLAALSLAALALFPAAADAQRARFDTQLIARIPAPGYPASAYPHPNGRVYVGTYTNPRGDTLPSRVFEFNPDAKRLLRSWVVPGQDLTKDHGIQAATSDAAGRLVLLDKAPSRALILDPRTGDFSSYSTFADLAPCSGGQTANCSPTSQDLPPFANYAAWGPGGELYVTDFQQAVVWRVPPGGGAATVWLADRKLDGQMFGTTGIALAADRRTLVVAQGSSGGASGGLTNPTTGKLYTVPITGDGSPGQLTQLWESAPTELPDGFGIAQSGRIYIALLNSNQIGVIAPDGREVERFPSSPDGQNGSPAPFDSPSSAKFLGTRLMVPNQSFAAGDPNNQTLLDVETGEPGLPELIPAGAGGVDAAAPSLSALSVAPSRVRSGRNFTLGLRLDEAAKLIVEVEQPVGSRFRRLAYYVRSGRTGANSFKVGARYNRGGRKRALPPGLYRVVVTARDASGNEAPERIRRLRVVR